MKEKRPMLSIYRSHDRELLFHGDEEACRKRGVRIKRAEGGRLTGGHVTLDGRRLKIVNHGTYTNGSAGLWVIA